MTSEINEFELSDELVDDFMSKHGPLVTGEDLWKTIGFTSAAAFRQAKVQGRLDLPVFSLPNRRGTFAFTKHVAEWLRNLAKEVEM